GGLQICGAISGAPDRPASSSKSSFSPTVPQVRGYAVQTNRVSVYLIQQFAPEADRFAQTERISVPRSRGPVRDNPEFHFATGLVLPHQPAFDAAHVQAVFEVLLRRLDWSRARMSAPRHDVASSSSRSACSNCIRSSLCVIFFFRRNCLIRLSAISCL